MLQKNCFIFCLVRHSSAPILCFSRIKVTFLDVTPSRFLSLVPCLKIYFTLSPQKQETDVSLVLKDSDKESENLSSLTWFSVSDSQKIDNSKDVSFIGI